MPLNSLDPTIEWDSLIHKKGCCQLMWQKTQIAQDKNISPEPMHALSTWWDMFVENNSANI